MAATVLRDGVHECRASQRARPGSHVHSLRRESPGLRHVAELCAALRQRALDGLADLVGHGPDARSVPRRKRPDPAQDGRQVALLCPGIGSAAVRAPLDRPPSQSRTSARSLRRCRSPLRALEVHALVPRSLVGPGGSASSRNLEPSTVRVRHGHGDESRARGTTPLPCVPCGAPRALMGPGIGGQPFHLRTVDAVASGFSERLGSEPGEIDPGRAFQSSTRPPWWICLRLFSVVA